MLEAYDKDELLVSFLQKRLLPFADQASCRICTIQSSCVMVWLEHFKAFATAGDTSVGSEPLVAALKASHQNDNPKIKKALANGDCKMLLGACASLVSARGQHEYTSSQIQRILERITGVKVEELKSTLHACTSKGQVTLTLQVAVDLIKETRLLEAKLSDAEKNKFHEPLQDIRKSIDVARAVVVQVRTSKRQSCIEELAVSATALLKGA